MSLLNGLVAYWKLDENSNDSLATYNGTDTSITYQAGKIGKGASFNGTSSKIGLGLFIVPVSISCWVKKTANVGEDDIFTKWSSGTSNDLVFWTDGTGRVGIYAEAFAENFNTTDTLATGVWYHVCYVNKFDGTNSKIFINGVEKASAAGTTLSAGTANSFFGSGDQGATNFLDGI